MAVAVGISAINAFTLSPALCALMLRPYKDEQGHAKDNFAARFRKAFNAAFDVLSARYMRLVLFFIRRKWLMWGTMGIAMLLLVFLMQTTKKGLIPDEDTGSVMISMDTKPGTSLQENRRVMQEVNRYVDKIPGIAYNANVTGYSFNGSGPSMGMFFLSLKHWDERKGEEQSSRAIIDSIYTFAPQVPDASLFAMAPPMIPGYGMGSGFELYLQDKQSGDLNQFKQVADNFVDALSKRPEIEMAYSSFATNYPQYWVDIDAAHCEQAGISTNEILQTLSDYYGGSYVSNFNRFSKLYRVQIQASPEYRVTPESLNHIYVRVGDEMTPLAQFVRLTKTYGPQDVSRFNLYNSIPVSGTPAKGYSSGDALKAIQETAEQVLPANYGYEFGGISREESQTTNNVVIIFALCLVLIYLILCALYESFLIPFSVILAVPCGLLGSFLFAQLFGLENNIYMQTGLIMLIGLLAKTAILQTEYAVKRRQAGMSLVQAAYFAAKDRLRPILMTVLAMIFGLLPLMAAHGVGANGCRSLASGVVGGMLTGTVALLLFVPVLFIVFQYWQEKIKPVQTSKKDADWAIQRELENLEDRK